MAENTRPPSGKADEKQETPWRVQFTCGKKNPSFQDIRKDLLVACWGNAKMADVLYHFLNAGSWKAFNSHMDESVRKVVLQEKHADIIKCLANKLKFKVKISEPTLITYLKLFAQAGYVCKYGHKGAQEINFDAIEQAFTNPPEKPVISKDLSSNLSLNEKPSNEVGELRQEVENLRAQVQDLSLTLVSFKSLCAQIEHEFKFNFSLLTKVFKLKKSDEDAQEADLEALFSSKNLSLDIRNEEEKESKKDDCAIAPCARLLALELEPDIEDFPAAQPKQVDASYSQSSSQAQQLTKQDGPAMSGGYRQTVGINAPTEPPPSSQQEKPTKRNGRDKKVEQPVLLDTNSKDLPLDEEEQRIYELYCNLKFIAVPPKINKTFKDHCRTLTRFVHTIEEMESLEKAARSYAKSLSKETWVLPLGWFVNDKVLNPWVASRRNEARTALSEQRSSSETTTEEFVVWTRYKHSGTAKEHWYLYNPAMPYAEAQQYGYKPDMIPLSDRQVIRRLHKSLAEGIRQLTPEQQHELETAEVRIHLVAVA